MAKVFVSVLIDTYNHERFIEKAIASVLEQDFPVSDREVLVIDDGSVDRTGEIVRKFGSQVRYIFKANGGQASAFNAGIPECNGQIIAFLDGDDWWARNKLSHVISKMEADPAIGMMGHAIIETFPDEKEKTLALGSEKRLRLNSIADAQLFRLSRCYLGTSRLAMRRDLALATLPVPDALIFEADEYLFTVGAMLADTLILDEPLCYYRIHGENLFFSSEKTSQGMRRKQKVLAALVTSLSQELAKRGMNKDVMRCILEIVEAEEAQLRLMLDGGSSLETYRTERLLYRIQHENASWKHRMFRQATMIPALLLPPDWFYKTRRWFAEQTWYQRARKEVVPVPEFTKVPASKQVTR